jgi:hypothetical protein
MRPGDFRDRGSALRDLCSTLSHLATDPVAQQIWARTTEVDRAGASFPQCVPSFERGVPRVCAIREDECAKVGSWENGSGPGSGRKAPRE